jgi:hypothetical protein
MLGIDCQGDRVEWQLVGFGRDYRRFVIDYGVIPNHISRPDCQEKLGALLRADLAQPPAASSAIDWPRSTATPGPRTSGALPRSIRARS